MIDSSIEGMLFFLVMNDQVHVWFKNHTFFFNNIFIVFLQQLLDRIEDFLNRV